MTTAADYRYVVLQHVRNRRLTAAATGRQYGIYPQTVRNRLRQKVQPIRAAYRPYFGHILTRRHRTARWDWCRRHLHFRRADCDLILFSDEYRFNLSHADGRETVYRHRGERFADACVIERHRFGGGSVLVCSGVGDIKTCLIVFKGNINAQSYINDVLDVEALPFIQFHGPNVTFMHDNDRPQSAAITRQFLGTNNVNVLDWPENSPDL